MVAYLFTELFSQSFNHFKGRRLVDNHMFIIILPYFIPSFLQFFFLLKAITWMYRL